MPKFQHDCDKCKYLGSIRYLAPMAEPYPPKMKYAELYFCPAEITGPTVIARFGSQGPHYASTMVSILQRDLHAINQSTSGPALVAAYHLACAIKLIDPSPNGSKR